MRTTLLIIIRTSRLIVVNESCFIRGFVFCDDGFLLKTATKRLQMAMIL